jgi:[ribosomal protein S5]-alanine N-acetyltransferase
MARLTLETERLELIAYDAELCAAHLEGIPAVAKLLGVTFPDPYMEDWSAQDWERTLVYLSSYPSAVGWCGWHAIDKATNQAIAYLGFYGKSDHHGQVEVGYEVAPAFRGKGYATEALLRLIAWVMGKSGVRAVFARCDEDNMAARRLLEKCGFAHVGQDKYMEYRLGSIKDPVEEPALYSLGPLQREPTLLENLSAVFRHFASSSGLQEKGLGADKSWHIGSTGMTYRRGEHVERYPYSWVLCVEVNPRGMHVFGGDTAFTIPLAAFTNVDQAAAIRRLLVDREVDVRLTK